MIVALLLHDTQHFLLDHHGTLLQLWQLLSQVFFFLLKKYFEKFEKPIFPLKSRDLFDKYKVKEGKDFGQKIKLLENIWLNNSFKLSKKEIDNVFGN